MTIKPVASTTQKRSPAGGAAVEVDKKDSHSVVSVNDGVSNSSLQTVNRASNSHALRNVVVLDGQGPQRRVDVYDDLNRHLRSPHKAPRLKRREHHTDHHLNKREKHVSPLVGSPSNKCNSPHASTSSATVSNVAAANNVAAHVTAIGGKSSENLLLGSQSPKTQPSSTAQAASGLLKAIEDTLTGYNSGDEHLQPKDLQTTADEWQRKDEQFAKCMTDRGYVLRPVEEDGACLFRAISLQIYGDEGMHDVIRQHTMDYVYKNREYFSQFVTEDINSYIIRKRRKDSHGNHIEIQAMSEIYSRPVEVYAYKPTPINIFNSEQLNSGYPPLRLSYQRGSHYNAILDPYNATVGVGLGLAGYKPDLQTEDAARLSEQLEIEQTMFEDKLKNSDWEATNEAIEEQIARESYLQWCRDNLQKTRNEAASSASASATVTSSEAISDLEACPSKYAAQRLLSLTSTESSSTASTVTATTASSSAVATNNNTSTNSERNFASLSPKHLSSMGHIKKTEDMGFESDDTDISTTSSVGNVSPSTVNRFKKSKSHAMSSGSTLNRMGKKRRRDAQNNEQKKNDMGVTPLLKSPKCDNAESAIDLVKRSATPDLEHQKPCTSKQSNSPDKSSCTAVNSAMSGSNFYQELLEATIAEDGNTAYATDGFGHLSESEMLQLAIQMSTRDYIEDQKRKYLYTP